MNSINCKPPDQMFSVLIREFQEFALKAFPNATKLSSLYKLRDEIMELETEIVTSSRIEGVIFEYVDCLMCIFDSANRAGISVSELIGAFYEKLEINKNRKWIENPDKTYSHEK